MDTALLTGLALLASLSPLLTFAWLWQVKEWRTDRLREHLRNEGCFRQLFGIVRPAVVLLFCVSILTAKENHAPLVTAALLLLSVLTLVQCGLHRQRFPVWTKKAMGIVAVALAIDAAVAGLWASSRSVFLVLLPLVQTFTLMFSWFLLWPLDRFLKNRRMRKAQLLRERFPDLTVIGITGSAGKTTVKELLSCILADRNTLCSPAYINSEMGIADWLLTELAARAETPPDILVCEMGAYRKGEIAKLCGIVRPAIGVVTSIGKQHMALFGSQQALIEAKAELMEALPDDGMAFLNADNDACAALAERARCPVHTVSTGGHSDTEAFDVEETAKGIAFRTGDTRFSIPLHGTHNVTNVLLAIAVAKTLNVETADIARSLARYTPPKHTFSVRTERGITILDDTHNASPASFKAAIAWSRTQPAEHKVLLTSGLIELGTEQDRIHTDLGEAAQGVFDRVIFLHPRSGECFEKGRGESIEIYTPLTQKISSDALLACVGRVPEDIIRKLLP